MRKILFFILIATLLLVGCQKKELQVQDISEPVKESSSEIISGTLHVENNEYFIDTIRKGKIHLNNKEDLLHFIPRSDLEYSVTYNQPKLKEPIKVSVEVDLESINIEEDVKKFNILKVLKIKEDNAPKNQSSFFFSDSYYKDVIEKLTFNKDIEQTEDIKEHPLYLKNIHFIEAVDTLLDKEYIIQLVGNNYEIIKIPNKLNYTPNNIEIGQQIAGLTVHSKDYKEDNYFSLKLKGSLKVKGRVRGEFNKKIGKEVFTFTSIDDNFEKPIKYNLRDKVKHINNYEGPFDMYDLLNREQQEYILDGNILEVEAILVEYNIRDRISNILERNLVLSDLAVITDENYNEHFDTSNDSTNTEVEATDFTKGYVIDSDDQSLSIIYEDTKERKYLIRSGDEETIYKGNTEEFFVMPIYEFKFAKSFEDNKLIYFMDEGSLFTYNLESDKIRVYYFDERIVYYNVFTNGNIAVETTTGKYKLYDRDQNFIKELENLEE